MLKAILESLDGLNDDFQKLYVEKDGKFHLQVDGLEDTGALKRAKEHEKTARQTAETKASDLQAQLDTLNDDINKNKDNKSREKGDIEALDASWQEKMTKREGEFNTTIEGLNSSLNGLLVDNVSVQMAAEISVEGSSNVLLPHIKARLGVEERDGKMVTVVKDGQGKTSALTVAELKKEFQDNPMFAPVIVGSKGSGGGAGGDGGDGVTTKQIDLNTASTKDFVAHIKTKQGN